MISGNLDFENGELLLIHKPLRWTSFDAVNKIRNILKKQLGLQKLKVGHAGTLDPLAVGLLIICTGKSTKKIHEYQGMEKEYTGTITLGATTPSFDLETKPDAFFTTGHISEEMIKKTAKDFIGTSLQYPPIFSAVKTDGKRAYENAREGKPVVVNPKEITITGFEVLEIKLPEIQFRITCSKGTYIRSVANDFGKALNSGAYLSGLCRTRIGNFKLSDSVTIEQFQELVKSQA